MRNIRKSHIRRPEGWMSINLARDRRLWPATGVHSRTAGCGTGGWLMMMMIVIV